MKRRISLFIAVSFIMSVCAAQEITFPALSGYKIKSSYPVYTRDNLWDFIDGAADSYLAYGFADLHVAEYKKGKDVIKAEIYRHSDPVNAFGIYSSERSPSFRFTNLGAQGYITGGSINFFKGNYYVKIRTYSKKEKTLQAEQNLAQRIASMLPGESAMPPALSMFPAEGKKANEETYINESVLGHSFLARAFKARYELGPDNFSIYIILDSSPEASRKTVDTYVASTGITPVETGEGRYMISDGYNGKIFIAWNGSRIVIISGLAQDQADIAERFTSDILK